MQSLKQPQWPNFRFMISEPDIVLLQTGHTILKLLRLRDVGLTILIRKGSSLPTPLALNPQSRERIQLHTR